MIDSLTLQHHIGPFLGEVFMGIVNCIFTVLGKPIDDKDEQVMLSFHNMTKFGNGVINFSQAWDKEKNLSSQQELNLPYLLPTKHKKSPICENKLPQKFCATWYDLPYTGWMLLITIELL